MTFQSVINGACEGASQVAQVVCSHVGQAANWLGRAVIVIGEHMWQEACVLGDVLSKLIASVCAFISPVLQEVANFAVLHQQTLIPAAAGVAVGVTATLTLGALLSKKEQPTPV